MNRDALIHQLVSMRAGIDAALAILTEDQPPDETSCPHEDRTDMSTMGIEKWECNTCGHRHERSLRGGDG